MASPQVENGYTRIANEIIESLCRVNLSPYESRVIWVIFRKTYGYGKKKDTISLSQFEKICNLDRRLVHRAIKSLSSRKMIAVISRDDRKALTYRFQKDYTKWLSSAEMTETIISRDDSLSSVEMTKLSSVEMNTKEKKETMQNRERDAR